jgi:hypothetical protein
MNRCLVILRDDRNVQCRCCRPENHVGRHMAGRPVELKFTFDEIFSDDQVDQVRAELRRRQFGVIDDTQVRAAMWNAFLEKTDAMVENFADIIEAEITGEQFQDLLEESR